MVHDASGDRRNKTERAFAEEWLEPRRLAGEVLAYWFEAVGLRIGERCFYHPDYLVWMSNGDIIICEVKGFMEDDALVKIRAVQEKYPFPVFVARRNKGHWSVERIGG